jgi:hypothetical protein
MAKRLTPHDERAVSVEAGVDPRLVRKYLDPKTRDRVRSGNAKRIRDALARCGFVDVTAETAA